MAWSSPTTLGSGSGTTSAASQSLSGITAAAGTFVVVGGFVRVGGTGTTGVTVSDSAGNSYAVHYEADPATFNGYSFIAWAVLTNPLSGGSITVTRVGASNLTTFAMGALSFTGGAGSEDTGVLAVANGTGTSPSVTGGVAAQSGDLLIAVCGYPAGSGNPYTEDAAAGWTNVFDISTAGTTSTFALAYQVNAGSAGIKHSPSLGASTKWAEVQAGFAPASGGGIAGTGAGTAGAPTASGAGRLDETGTGAATAAAPSASGAGTLSETGTGAATAPSPMAVGSGTLDESGGGAAAAPAPTAQGSGTEGPPGTGGSGAGSAASPTAAGSGTLDETGIGSATAAPPTAAGTGTVSPSGGVSGTGSAAAGAPSAAGLGTTPPPFALLMTINFEPPPPPPPFVPPGAPLITATVDLPGC